MFGSAAVSLLKLMGQSGNVPGAIMAEDIPEALKQLQEGLQRIASSEADSATSADTPHEYDDAESEAAVGLDKRAGPLISLLEASAAQNENVLWDS